VEQDEAAAAQTGADPEVAEVGINELMAVPEVVVALRSSVPGQKGQ
jgi:hypothetical protein